MDDVSSAFSVCAFCKDLYTIGPSLYIHPLPTSAQPVRIDPSKSDTGARYLGDTLRALDFLLSFDRSVKSQEIATTKFVRVHHHDGETGPDKLCSFV